MNTELPTIKEELTRKSLDELESLVHNKSTGKITNAEFKIGINVLFSICSGIVDDDFFELITLAGDGIESDNSFVRITALSNKKNVIFLLHKMESTKISIWSGDIKKVREIVMSECSTDNMVKDKVDDIAHKLKKSGYKKLTFL